MLGMKCDRVTNCNINVKNNHQSLSLRTYTQGQPETQTVSTTINASVKVVARYTELSRQLHKSLAASRCKLRTRLYEILLLRRRFCSLHKRCLEVVVSQFAETGKLCGGRW
jgi:hypothetical protein